MADSMAKKYRVGIIGFASMYVNQMAALYARHPQVEMVACADTVPLNPELRAAPYTRQWNMKHALTNLGVKKAYEDYHLMLAQEHPDIVLVASENAQHPEVVEACAAHRAHVCVERPMAASYAGALRMVRACRAAGTTMLVNWPLTWSPGARKIKSLINLGEIGRLLQVKWHAGHTGPLSASASLNGANYETPPSNIPAFLSGPTVSGGSAVLSNPARSGSRSPLSNLSVRGEVTMTGDSTALIDRATLGERIVLSDIERGATWWYQSAAGGGAMLDFCGHGAMLSLWYVGEPATAAFGMRANLDSAFGDVDDNGTILVRFPNAMSILEGSWTTVDDGIPSGPTVRGTTGTLVLDSFDRVRLERGRGQTVIYRTEPLPAGRENVAGEMIHHLETHEPLHQTLDMSFNAEAMAILDAGIRAAASGKLEPVSSPVWQAG